MKITIPDQVLVLIDCLKGCGFEAFVVGGCVRDSILGHDPKDWDLTTNATPQEMKICFSAFRVLETGVKHGTLTVLVDKKPFEVTTYRVDGKYDDNRRPTEVFFVGDIEKDLSRRDFTVNAMAYSPESGLVDPFGGYSDLEARMIRCVGDPDARFHEDALRLLRALRFSSVLQMAIDKATSESIHKNKDLLRNISSERISVELVKLLNGKDVRRIMLEYPDVFGVFIPEILPMVGFDQNNPHHRYDVWAHTAAAVAAAPAEAVLRLVMLLHDIGKPPSYTEDKAGVGHFYGHQEVSAGLTGEILKRLRFDNETIDTVTALVLHHDKTVKPEPRHILKWLGKLGPDNYKKLLMIKLADAAAQNPEEYPETEAEIESVRKALEKVLAEQRCYSLKDLAVGGDDLMALGIPRGVRIGRLLNTLLDMVIDGKVDNDKPHLLKAAQSLMAEDN